MTKGLSKNVILWKEEYNINEITIDKEHENLFNLAQKALNINLLGNNDKLKEIISELLLYTKTHFANEQAFMKKIYYPDYDKHLILHKTMISSLTSLVQNLNHLNIFEIEDKLYSFIEEYFLNHIITEDKKIHIWNTPLSNLKNNFGWKDVYSVNNDYIDADHKILFNIAKEAFEVVESSERIAKIRIIIQKLYKYMKGHFDNEEKFMEQIKYPNYDEHKTLHRDIIEKLNSFIKSLPSMHIEIFEKELAKIIDISLLQHIIQEDRKIVLWRNKL